MMRLHLLEIPARMTGGMLGNLFPPLPAKLTPLQNDHSNQGA
jgi:hypothetical protein